MKKKSNNWKKKTKTKTKKNKKQKAKTKTRPNEKRKNFYMKNFPKLFKSTCQKVSYYL